MKRKFLIFLPSTWSYIQEGMRAKEYALKNLVHGYIYSRWIYLYISIGTGEHFIVRKLKPLTRLLYRVFGAPASKEDQRERITFADTYHGKVLRLDDARQLVSVNKKIEIDDLEQVIPYKLARTIILENPEHIAVIDCPCRNARSNPCGPLDVCLVIGKVFTDFTLEHHPKRCRKINHSEAMAILEAEHKRGHVHHAFFKSDLFNRFYAICNCCSCCCGAIEAWRKGTPMLASSGYVTTVDDDKCIACGVCVKFCQFGALSKDGERIITEEEHCLGCGVCVSKCRQKARRLRRDVSRGEPLEVNRLAVEMKSRASNEK